MKNLKTEMKDHATKLFSQPIESLVMEFVEKETSEESEPTNDDFKVFGDALGYVFGRELISQLLDADLDSAYNVANIFDGFRDGFSRSERMLNDPNSD